MTFFSRLLWHANESLVVGLI